MEEKQIGGSWVGRTYARERGGRAGLVAAQMADSRRLGSFGMRSGMDSEPSSVGAPSAGEDSRAARGVDSSW